ncbi:hypothetical protein P153DRAFT_331916 [Dothidotthia symphoricarpi CBS 119687]|uniref:PWWP domain-containing protein n=1 Tax=Dothidotthia symphoricarpi CBS 119687 TaxID=1392245 RepID=A0A6A6AND8_9PLEO|nr:uncharacterized protein P153DRAFT_331916 [Dothidotthia symphoricarpi CBS 119687]KAF2133300.1 hypothetical protein P153DRAFT_331916 [Dothidotthia symphoricarpi CBS 119687]
MVSYTPGRIIHYRQHGKETPLWPAVVCTENVAPNEFLQTRPAAYVTLILLIGEYLEFRWALTSEMNEYNPQLVFDDEELIENTPGLGEAYAIADSARDAGLGLNHWRNEVRKMTVVTSSDEEDADMNSEEDDSDMDEDMKQAIRASRADFLATKRSMSFMPSISSLQQQERPSRKRSSWEDEGPYTTCHDPDLDFDEDLQKAIAASRDEYWGTTSGALPTPSLSPPRPPKRRRDSDLVGSFEASCTPRHVLLSRRRDSTTSLSPNLDNNSRHQRCRDSPIPTRENSADQQPSNIDGNVIEGDLSESKEYVEFLVGPDKEARNILKSYVDACPAFKRNFLGTSYLTTKGENGWALVHPSLRDIDPRDFEFIAQFLETRDFGIRFPDSDEENTSAIAECCAAWDAAEKLGMEDMLDYIALKAQRLAPWGLAEVLWMAIAVYRTPDAASAVQGELRAMLSGYMAEHFWEYINDDSLGVVFQERVGLLPELGRDVHLMISTTLGRQIEPGYGGVDGEIGANEDGASDLAMS